MNKAIVISSIAGSLHLDEEDSQWLYDHISQELKDKIDLIRSNQRISATLPEAIDYLFGTLSNKLRCNEWLCRLADEKRDKYEHLSVNLIPTEMFIIEFDRAGGEEFRSQENYDWEQASDWSEE